MYVHGGGWMQGSIETHDSFCRKITNLFGMEIYSTNYRLAPEYPFPTPLNDVFTVFSELAERNPDKKIVISGDSAGGNLCAALCIKISQDKFKVKPWAQILLYPSLSSDFTSNSFMKYGNVAALTKAGVEYFYKQYAGEEKSNPLVYPLLWHWDAASTPTKTLFLAAECDVLMDDQIKLKEKLVKAGCIAELFVVNGAVHGFSTYGAEFENEINLVLQKAKNWLWSEDV
jgi:acetyl esterase